MTKNDKGALVGAGVGRTLNIVVPCMMIAVGEVSIARA